MASPLANLAMIRRTPQPEAAVSLVYVLRPAAAEELLAAIPVTDCEQRTIRLQMVPGGRDAVRAIVSVVDHDGRSIAYELILPSAEQQLAVAELTRENFASSGDRPNGRAWIEVGYGDAVVARDWTPEPRLDDLVERVIRDGRRIPVLHSGPSRPVLGTATVARPGKATVGPAGIVTVRTADTAHVETPATANLTLD